MVLMIVKRNDHALILKRVSPLIVLFIQKSKGGLGYGIKKNITLQIWPVSKSQYQWYMLYNILHV